MQPSAYFFFGRSGCGKGTQAALLRKKLEERGESVIYIETGSLLRRFAESDSYTAKRVRAVMDQGGLMPEFLPVHMWAGELVSQTNGTEIFMFDGVSRQIHEAPLIESMLMFYDRLPAHIVYIDVSREWSSNRLRARNRFDDTEESIEARQNWFESSVLPVLEYFKQSPNFVFHKIHGEQSIEDVQADLVASLAREKGSL
jgi:adenylate kinase family enzyme